MSNWSMAMLEFPHGIVTEIRAEQSMIDATSFGDEFPVYRPGLQSVTMELRLNGTDAIEAVLRALGASDKEARAISHGNCRNCGAGATGFTAMCPYCGTPR